MPDGTIEAAMSSIRDALYWAPPWASGVALLVLAALVALIAHRIVLVALNRASGDRYPLLRSIVRRTQRPLALAMVAFALAAALQAAPFDPAVSTALSHILALAFVVLAGWIAHIAVETACSIYLMRFEIGSTDNLLARKHVTQVRILKRAAHTLIIVITLSAALMTFEPVRQYGVSLFASAGVAGLVVGLAARPVLSNLFAGIQLAMTQPIRHRRPGHGRERIRPRRGDHLDLCGDPALGPAAADRPARPFHREAVPELEPRIRPTSSARCCSTSTTPRRWSASAPRRWRSCRPRSCGTARWPSSRSPTPSESSIELRVLGERAHRRRRLRPALRDSREADRLPAAGIPDRIAAHAPGGRSPADRTRRATWRTSVPPEPRRADVAVYQSPRRRSERRAALGGRRAARWRRSAERIARRRLGLRARRRAGAGAAARLSGCAAIRRLVAAPQIVRRIGIGRAVRRHAVGAAVDLCERAGAGEQQRGQDRDVL